MIYFYAIAYINARLGSEPIANTYFQVAKNHYNSAGRQFYVSFLESIFFNLIGD